MVNVTLKNAEIFGSVLSGEDGSADGWRCCRDAPGRFAHLPPTTPKYLPPSITSSLLLFCFGGDVSKKQYSIRAAEGKLFSSKKCGEKSRLVILVSAVRYSLYLKILHSQPFAAAYIHGDEAGS